MKAFLGEFRAAVMSTLILTAVCCGIYPLVVFGLGQLLFNNKANGSLIVDNQGIIRGSTLVGQQFSGDGYFHSRPSSAGDGYDAANSGGSNLGPTSKKLNDVLKERIEHYRTENRLGESDPVPADAVTSSGSGLDPHISVRNAQLQLPRVARARGLSEDRVHSLLESHTSRPDWAVLGEPRVNVMALNLALELMDNPR